MKRLAARSMIVAAVTSALCELWPSDRWLATALPAYAPPLLILLAACAALFLLRDEPPDRWLAWAAAAACFGAISIAQDHAGRPELPTNRAANCRLVHWNVANSDPTDELRPLHPDIVCINEPGATPKLGVGWNALKRLHLLILSRHRIEEKRVWQGEGIRALHAIVHCDPPLSVLLVDVSAHPLRSRRAALEALADVLPSMRPDVVAGDLNTPVSAWSVRSAFGGDFRPAGGASPYTWPSILPLMKIDYILVRKGVRIAGHDHGFAPRSDHAWQSVDLAR